MGLMSLSNHKPTKGEKLFAKNIAKIKKDKSRKQNPNQVLRYFKTLLGNKEQTGFQLSKDKAYLEAREEIFKLQEELAQAKIENRTLTAKLKEKDTFQNKATPPTEPSPEKPKNPPPGNSHLSAFLKLETSLNQVLEKINISKILHQTASDMKESTDGFHKIRIYRQAIASLKEFKSITHLLAPLLQNREEIKNRRKMTELTQKLKAFSDYEEETLKLLEKFSKIYQSGDKINHE